MEQVAAACAGRVKVSDKRDDHPDLSLVWKIQSIPTLLYFVDGNLRAKIVGTPARSDSFKLRSVSQGGDSKVSIRTRTMRTNTAIVNAAQPSRSLTPPEGSLDFCSRNLALLNSDKRKPAIVTMQKHTQDHENNRIYTDRNWERSRNVVRGAEVEPALAPTVQHSDRRQNSTPSRGGFGRRGWRRISVGVRHSAWRRGGGRPAAFGSRQAHDFALTSVSYGYMLGEVVGQGHWYRGNWKSAANFQRLQVSHRAIGWLD